MLHPHNYSKNLPAGRTLTPDGVKNLPAGRTLTPAEVSRGVSIIELLLVVFIIGMAFTALLAFGSISLRTASFLQHTTQASFLAQDILEAVKNYRDNTDWEEDNPGVQYDGLGVVPTGTALHPELSGDTPPKWQLLTGSETIGRFAREATVNPVFRDASDNIVPSGGSLDPDTREVVVTISWIERGEAKQLQAASYLTNWRP